MRPGRCASRSLRGSSGSIAMSVTRGTPTAAHSVAMSTGSAFQVAPASSLRKTVARDGVPVPTKTTLSSDGWKEMRHTC